MKEFKEGDILTCKRTIYKIEEMTYKKTKLFLHILYFLKTITLLSYYKKGKKYTIKRIVPNSTYKGLSVYFLDDYPILEEWIENVFITEKDIRKLKLEKLQKLYEKLKNYENY